MLKKILVIGAAILIATAGAAHAQDPYAGDDGIAASDSTPAPGEEITVTARTFQPSSSVTFSIGAEVLGAVVANTEGVASITFSAPTSPGTYTITAEGIGLDGQPLTVTTTITVAGTAAGGSGLPTTGSDGTISMSQVALASLIGGGLLVLIANKRRSSATAERETAGV